MIKWRYDVENAPQPYVNFIAYFPLENLSKDWDRAVIGYLNSDDDFVFMGRATHGYSKIYKFVAWSELNVPGETQNGT